MIRCTIDLTCWLWICATCFKITMLTINLPYKYIPLTIHLSTDFSKCNDLSFFTGKQPGGPSIFSWANSNVQIAVESDAQQASKTNVIWLHPSLLTLQPRKVKLKARVLYQVRFQQLFTSIWSLSLYFFVSFERNQTITWGNIHLIIFNFRSRSSELLYQLSSRFFNAQIHIVSSLYCKRFWRFDWSLFQGNETYIYYMIHIWHWFQYVQNVLSIQVYIHPSLYLEER